LKFMLESQLQLLTAITDYKELYLRNALKMQEVCQFYEEIDARKRKMPDSEKSPLKKRAKTVIEGTYPCTAEGCGSWFSSNYAVKRHMATVHRGEKLHVCPTCERKFGQPSTLKRHMQSHNGPFVDD